MWIYILKLENGKYYIGTTINSKFSIKDSIDSYWTNIHKPIKLLEMYPIENYTEDYYINKYGEDNIYGLRNQDYTKKMQILIDSLKSLK